MHIHYNDLYNHALALNPDINKINNLCRPFLGYYCFILNLSDPCPSVDKKRRNFCSLHDDAPAQEPLLRA